MFNHICDIWEREIVYVSNEAAILETAKYRSLSLVEYRPMRKHVSFLRLKCYFRAISDSWNEQNNWMRSFYASHQLS